MNTVTIPENLPDLNSQPFRGSFQQLFLMNVGKTVKIDFLVGSANLVSQTGVIQAATSQYVLLYQAARDTFIACDNFSVKFVTFF